MRKTPKLKNPRGAGKGYRETQRWKEADRVAGRLGIATGQEALGRSRAGFLAELETGG